MPKNRHPNLDALCAAALASGVRVGTFASENKISRRQAYRIAEKPEVQRQAAQIRGRMIDRTIGRMSKAADRAAATMINFIFAGKRPDALLKRDVFRRDTAKALLSSLTELRTHAELAARLDAMEASLAPPEPPKPKTPQRKRGTS